MAVLIGIGATILFISLMTYITNAALLGTVATLIGPSFKAWLIAGYSVGGALLLLGLSSAFTHNKKEKLNAPTSPNTGSLDEISNTLNSRISDTALATSDVLSQVDIEIIPPNGRKDMYAYDSVKLAVPPNAACYTDYDNIPFFADLSLEAEPENPHDNKAVKVMYGEEKIGYLFRGRLQDMFHDFSKRGDSYVANFLGENAQGYPEIYLSFHRKSE